MMTWSVVLGVSFLVMGLMPSEVGPSYPSNGQTFLPELKGGKPDCVKDPRDTFCTDPKQYPKERILYLLKNKMFNVDSMLMDESRDSYIFESRDAPSVPTYGYDPVRQTFHPPGQKYGPPRQSYDPPTQSYIPPSQNYGPPQPPALPSSGYLPPRHNYTAKYGSHHTSYSGGLPYQFGNPAPPYENEGPYTRYRKNTPPSSYLTRYLTPPPPRVSAKSQAWWNIPNTVIGSSRRRQKRQLSSSELCPYTEDYLMPRAALSNKGQWMFLVNLEEESEQFTQFVQIKRCIAGTTCSGSCNVPDGFTATCQQQYVQKRLIALDGSGSTLNQDLFWFPACCLCTIVPGG